MQHKRLYFGTIILVIFTMVILGCMPPKDVYISTTKIEPSIISANSEFTLLYEVENPKDNADLVYIKIAAPLDCVSYVDRAMSNSKVVSLGEIKSEESKPFYVRFKSNSNSEGKTCKIALQLYPTKEASRPIFEYSLTLKVAERTGSLD